MRRGNYSSDGLTINWFDRQKGVPKNRQDWWATEDGSTNPFGFSYCLVNVPASAPRVKTIVSELVANTTAPFEVKIFEDDMPKMPDLFPHCRYSWTQRISVDEYETREDYNPKISIVMSTFKRQHCILRTVGWVLDQDYSNWELILIDNEKDGPGLPQMPNDPRISTYNLAKESNTAYPRNEGLKLATGDIICNFDDDDEMTSGFLRKMSAPFCNPDVQVVRCGMKLGCGGCDFSYSTQEAWLRREYATPTWSRVKGIHDQIYYHDIVAKNKWTRKNIVQTGEVLVIAHTEPIGGRRTKGAED